MAIISLSGRLGSGKDTVGLIIQYLTLGLEKTDIDFKEFYRRYPTLPNIRAKNPFEIKKFADKIKDIICLLINCTREELEDQQFKNKPLSEQWQTEGKPVMTPRLMLQLIGTEGGRDLINNNIWVNSLFSNYKPYSAKGSDYEEYESKWIITDMRFPNEMQAVKEREGITIRVNRMFHAPITLGNGISEIDTDQHPSETALDNAEFDYVIDNNGTIEELIEKVRKILTKENIIK